MNLQAFARQIIKDPAYRASLVARANAGTLPPDLELLLWEIADSRAPSRAEVRSALRIVPPKVAKLNGES
jgi:hypothetical protein